MKTRTNRSSHRRLFALAAVLIALAPDRAPAAPAEDATAVQPLPFAWFWNVFAPPAADAARRDATGRLLPVRTQEPYDRRVSDSFTLHQPARAASGAETSAFRLAQPAPAPALRLPDPERTVAPGNFSVPIVAPTAARVPGLEPLPWTAASAGSAQPSGLAASAAPALNSTRGPVFSLGSTPASFGADGTAAAPLAFGPAVDGAPSTRRSTAVSGPQPRAAGDQGVVDTTNPSFGTYLGPTYTVPSGGDAFAYLYDGYNQAGTVTHSSGTLTISGYLSLGYYSGSSGTYNLSGTGTINTPYTYVGYLGTGVFNQSGGTHNIYSTGLKIGYATPAANGTYTLSGGTLNVTGRTYLGTYGAGVFTQSGGTATLGQLLFVGDEPTASGTVNLNTGGTLNLASIALDFTNGGTSTFNFNGGTFEPTSSNGTTFFPSVLTTANVRNGGAYINTNGFNVTVAQPLVHSTVGGDNAEDGGLTKSGAGTLTLSGANTYTGVTGISGGILNVASLSNYGVASAIGSRAASAEATSDIGLLLYGGTLQYTGSTNQSTNRQIRLSNNTTNAIDSSGSGTLAFTYSGTNTDLFANPGTRTLNLTGTNTGSNVFAIGLTDQSGNATSLTKAGAGQWVLTGANTYTGPTNVNGGTLLFNGTNSGTGAVTVQNSGSTLGGTGTISAPVTVTGSGAINPGTNGGANGSAANVGTLTIGALTLTSTATSIFDLVNTTTYDKLVVNGTSSLGGALTLYANAGTTFTTGSVLDLIHDNGGVLTGAFTNAATGSTYTTSGETFTVLQTATDFELVAVTAVPEPATWLAGALLLAGSGWTLRRQRRASAVWAQPFHRGFLIVSPMQHRGGALFLSCIGQHRQLKAELPSRKTSDI